MMEEVTIKNVIAKLYEGDDFYIYFLKKVPLGPWLDNGKIITEIRYIDKKLENDLILKVENSLMYDDGGTREYNFSNGQKLIVPQKRFNYCDKKLQYGDIILQDIGIENEIVNKILDKNN